MDLESIFGGLAKGLGGNFSGIGNFLGNYFNDTSASYKAAEDPLNDAYNRAKGFQNPFFGMGQSAIPQYQQWLQGQQDPSGFINNLMGQYQESPWAKYNQQQGIRSAQNLGSASGLTGSTPLMLQAQQNAQNISSNDMQNWLANVLGINMQYGSGLQNQITGGQNAANQLSSLNRDYGQDLAGLRYNEREAENQRRGNLWGGLFSL